MDGWIKLHRKMLEWEWWDDPITFWVFCKCLLLANHKDKKWRGILIKKGSFISSYSHLASKKSKVSVRNVRTSIKKLKSTGELTVKSNNKYSIITIYNWNKYQQDDRQTVTQVTSKRQATDKQLTTTKNDKNDKNVRSITSNTQSVYGNKEITYLIEYLKEKLELPALDDSILVNRRYCYLLLKKFGNANKVKILIEATAGHDFWSTKIASFKQLYYKAVTIISSTRDKRLEVTKV